MGAAVAHVDIPLVGLPQMAEVQPVEGQVQPDEVVVETGLFLSIRTADVGGLATMVLRLLTPGDDPADERAAIGTAQHDGVAHRHAQRLEHLLAEQRKGIDDRGVVDGVQRVAVDGYLRMEHLAKREMLGEMLGGRMTENVCFHGIIYKDYRKRYDFERKIRGFVCTKGSPGNVFVLKSRGISNY